MSTRLCENCAWWDEIEVYRQTPRRYGHCRYNAPSIASQNIWPRTGENDWCRQHAVTRGWVEDERNEGSAIEKRES